MGFGAISGRVGVWCGRNRREMQVQRVGKYWYSGKEDEGAGHQYDEGAYGKEDIGASERQDEVANRKEDLGAKECQDIGAGALYE